ncbi:luciferase domain-containing protein [Paenibacillus alkalitolerans]|uniref:luciferase domain-containing protein n=1 Tax=Paenibacillus alkalitolerans TaxID=2799335 RepID=UPI0018F545F5|nr:luciferase family protein [Paenibacillus alkalitolerans]
MNTNRKETLTAELLSWPGVTVQPHRFGGIEFNYEGKEIGHLHGDHLVDMLLPKSIRDEMISAGRAQPHHIYPESGWVSIYLKSETDTSEAIELLRLKYELMKNK